MNRKPDWIRTTLKTNKNFHDVYKLVKKYNIYTICIEAKCPNIFNCWSSRTATFLILGDICTRNCKFCGVKKGNPRGYVDDKEPIRIAHAVKELGIKYVVITSVDRDDLKDYGASQFVNTINHIRKLNNNIYIEVLTPDFGGRYELIKTVVDAKPDVFSHNIETVRRLTPIIRDRRASYDQSLKVLGYVKNLNSSIITKSSIIVGLGEKTEEVVKTMEDLRDVGVDIVTIGQYLQPTPKQYPVIEYVHPRIFKYYKNIGYKLGFKLVISGPLVRSSYLAGKYYLNLFIQSKKST